MAEMSKAMFELHEGDIRELKDTLTKHQKDPNKPRNWFRKYARSSIPGPQKLKRNVQAVMRRFQDAVDISTGELLINGNTLEAVDRLYNLADAGKLSGR